MNAHPTIMADSRSSGASSAVEPWIGSAIILVCVLYAIVIVCLVLFMNKLIKTISKHPKHPALWLPIASLVVCTALAVITQAQVQLLFGCLALFSTIALVIATYAVDLHYDHLFPDDSKTVQATMNKLMGEHWWSDKKTQFLP